MRFGECEVICPRHCASAERARLIDIACDQECWILRLSTEARVCRREEFPSRPMFTH